MINQRSHTLTILFALITALAVGCDHTMGTSNPANGESQTSRLEHHVPAHHPASYADAVDQISRRTSEIHSQKQNVDSDSQSRQLHELLDILEWLPAIAADSDLRKADWELVNQHARQLKSLYQPSTQSVVSESRTDQKIWEDTLALIGDLNQVVPASHKLH